MAIVYKTKNAVIKREKMTFKTGKTMRYYAVFIVSDDGKSVYSWNQNTLANAKKSIKLKRKIRE